MKLSGSLKSTMKPELLPPSGEYLYIKLLTGHGLEYNNNSKTVYRRCIVIYLFPNKIWISRHNYCERFISLPSIVFWTVRSKIDTTLRSGRPTVVSTTPDHKRHKCRLQSEMSTTTVQRLPSTRS